MRLNVYIQVIQWIHSVYFSTKVAVWIGLRKKSKKESWPSFRKFNKKKCLYGWAFVIKSIWPNSLIRSIYSWGENRLILIYNDCKFMKFKKREKRYMERKKEEQKARLRERERVEKRKQHVQILSLYCVLALAVECGTLLYTRPKRWIEEKYLSHHYLCKAINKTRNRVTTD